MALRPAPTHDRSFLLPLLPGSILIFGLVRQGVPFPDGMDAGRLLAFAAWNAGFVLLARRAAGRDGALVAASAGGLAAVGLVVAGTLHPEGVQGGLLFWWLASAVALLAAATPWERMVRYPRLAACASAGLLLLPLVAGIEVGGARAWVRLGDLGFQPGELARILGILVLAGSLARAGGARPGAVAGSDPLGDRRPVGRAALSLGATWLLLTGLWVAQRDLGGAGISYLLFPLAWFLAGGGWMVTLLATGLGLGGGLGLISLYPHASARVAGWSPPWEEMARSSYQQAQGLVSLRLGGLWGQGAGGGAGAGMVPAAATDLPLAVVAQGAGVLAVWGILYLQWCIVDRGLRAASRAPGLQARLVVGTAALLWALEVLVPVAGWLGLVPLTGVPLPLVSRGGSALLAHGLVLGWLLWGLRRARAGEGPRPRDGPSPGPS